MSVAYHGKLPVTKSDVKMAKKHLKATYKLNKQKIKDHQKAMKDAADSKSVSYNKTHLTGHQKDNAQIQQSLHTVNGLTGHLIKKGNSMAKVTVKKTGSFKGQPNKLGGGGRFKQMVSQGMSPGLVAYIGKKKYGASNMAKMAAAGKKA